MSASATPTSHSPASALRSTQRAPRSCTSCYTRKTKCDKKMPCSACIRRGATQTCTRETVVVRGIVTTATDVKLSYQELEKENKRLKRALSQSRPSRSIRDRREASTSSTDLDLEQALDFDRCENKLFLDCPQHSPSPHNCIPFIQLPSRECSRAIVRYGTLWLSWVHFALDNDKFEAEHEAFWNTLALGSNVEDQDPSWLAIYFGFMTSTLQIMDADQTRASGLSYDDQDRLLRSWYNAALYFLDRADYMRYPDIRSVQAIAILGMCFANFGDTNRYMLMWSCAIRIAQKLGLHEQGTLNRTCLGRAHSSRLWWTLIICEWMAPIDYPPCIQENDFKVPFEWLVDEDEGERHSEYSVYPDVDPDPVCYHIAMAQIATVYHRFRKGIRLQTDSVFDLVRIADEQLANIISGLPSHLQPDEHKTPQTELRDKEKPWIPWQQFSITLVLLYHRLSINRPLQHGWLRNPGIYHGQRAICLDSAKAIIEITSKWDHPIARRRQWAFGVHVFAAGMCLILESKGNRDKRLLDWENEVNHCVAYLTEIKSRSVIARQGLKIMSQLMARQV